MSNELELEDGKVVSNAPNQQQIDWQQKIGGLYLYEVAVTIYAEVGTWKEAVVELKERHGIRTYPENMRSAVSRWLTPSDVPLERKRPNVLERSKWFADFMYEHGIPIEEWYDFCAERVEKLK